MDLTLKSPAQKSRFDWIVNSRSNANRDAWDVRLVESAAFVAIPSLGSIVPGWVLIVPRMPATNIATLSDEDRVELSSIRLRVATILTAAFPGEVYEFEHGPARAGGLLGCGVEQAHVHMVPLDFDLVGAVTKSPAAGEIKYALADDPWRSVEPDRDYWLVRDAKAKSTVITYPAQPVSQGIRKIIASRVGRPDMWNYREYRHEENVDLTVRAFGALMTA